MTTLDDAKNDRPDPEHPDHGHPDPKPPEPPKSVTVIVNGTKHEIPKRDELSFEEVIELAFPGHPTGPNWSFTVTYDRAGGHKPTGTLVSGQSVTVKDRMIFNATATDKS